MAGCYFAFSFFLLSSHALAVDQGDSTDLVQSMAPELSKEGAEEATKTTRKKAGLSKEGAEEVTTGGWMNVNVYVGNASLPFEENKLYSQAGQDWLVASMLSCKKKGFFIDLAANDATRISNTFLLEQRFQWAGLCIEANTDYLFGLAHRACNVLVAAVGQETDHAVEFTFDGAVGGIVNSSTNNTKAVKRARSEKLRTVRLYDVMLKMNVPDVIDYMSLDVEGAESMVMDSFPWDTKTILILSVERPKPDLKELLQAHGYHFLRQQAITSTKQLFGEEVWIHESIPDFATLKNTYAGEYPADTCMTALGYGVPGHV